MKKIVNAGIIRREGQDTGGAILNFLCSLVAKDLLQFHQTTLR